MQIEFKFQAVKCKNNKKFQNFLCRKKQQQNILNQM
jgi:hypothetical protein